MRIVEIEVKRSAGGDLYMPGLRYHNSKTRETKGDKLRQLLSVRQSPSFMMNFLRVLMRFTALEASTRNVRKVASAGKDRNLS